MPFAICVSASLMRPAKQRYIFQRGPMHLALPKSMLQSPGCSENCDRKCWKCISIIRSMADFSLKFIVPVPVKPNHRNVFVEIFRYCCNKNRSEHNIRREFLKVLGEKSKAIL